MKILIVPDVHGRTFWKKIQGFEGKIIFLGDYHDPYGFEKISQNDSVANFKEIIDFAISNPNVTLLLGNHDICHYWNGLQCNASRFDRFNFQELCYQFRVNSQFFKPYELIDNILFTHSGLTSGWLKSTGIENWEEAMQISFSKLSNLLLEPSSIRGGSNEYGSFIWNDVREINKLDNLLVCNEDIKYQVFGHTYLTNVGSMVKVPNGVCVDSRSVFEIDTDDPNNTIKEWR